MGQVLEKEFSSLLHSKRKLSSVSEEEDAERSDGVSEPEGAVSTASNKQLQVSVVSHDIVQEKSEKFVVYNISVVFHPSAKLASQWHQQSLKYVIRKRYSELYNFHQTIKKKFSRSPIPPFPPKQIIRSFNEEHLLKKASELNEYINKLLPLEEVTKSDEMLELLHQDFAARRRAADETQIPALLIAGEEWKKPREIKSGGHYTYPVEITETGMVVCWEFRTEAYDIGFSVDFEGREVIPYARLASYSRTFFGSFTAEKEGICMLQWHNSYSRLRKKTLFFRIKTCSAADVADFLLKSPQRDSLRESTPPPAWEGQIVRSESVLGLAEEESEAVEEEKESVTSYSPARDSVVGEKLMEGTGLDSMWHDGTREKILADQLLIVTAKLKDMKTALEDAQQSRDWYEGKLLELKQKGSTDDVSIGRMKQDLMEARERLRSAEAESLDLGEQLRQWRDSTEKSKVVQSSLQRSAQQMELKMEGLVTQLQESQEDARDLRRKNGRLESRLERLVADLEHARSDAKQWEKRALRAEKKDTDALLTQIETLQAQLKQTTRDGAVAARIAEKCKEDARSASEAIASRDQQLSTLKKQRRVLAAEICALRQQIQKSSAPEPPSNLSRSLSDCPPPCTAPSEPEEAVLVQEASTPDAETYLEPPPSPAVGGPPSPQPKDPSPVVFACTVHPQSSRPLSKHRFLCFDAPTALGILHACRRRDSGKNPVTGETFELLCMSEPLPLDQQPNGAALTRDGLALTVSMAGLSASMVSAGGKPHEGVECSGCGHIPVVGNLWLCFDCGCATPTRKVTGHDHAPLLSVATDHRSIQLCDGCYRRGVHGFQERSNAGGALAFGGSTSSMFGAIPGIFGSTKRLAQKGGKKIPIMRTISTPPGGRVRGRNK